VGKIHPAVGGTHVDKTSSTAAAAAAVDVVVVAVTAAVAAATAAWATPTGPKWLWVVKRIVRDFFPRFFVSLSFFFLYSSSFPSLCAPRRVCRRRRWPERRGGEGFRGGGGDAKAVR